jgi:uncharacterized protein YkwD
MHCCLGVRAGAGHLRDRRHSSSVALRLWAALSIAVLLMLAITLNGSRSASAGARAASAARIAELPRARLLAGINSLRRSRGLSALTLSEPLARGAQARAYSMAQKGYFAHVAPDGTPFWREILRYYKLHGFARWKVGENILWSVATVTSDEIVGDWLASPEHAEILLNPGWTQIGTETIRASSAPGFYGNRDVTIVVAEFGTRIR